MLRWGKCSAEGVGGVGEHLREFLYGREMADKHQTECNIASRRKDVADRQLAEDGALLMLQTAGRRQKEKGSKQNEMGRS
jgi:hypothetical protein